MREHNLKKLQIEPYTLNDNEEALALEKQCVQGKSMAFSFQRTSFHARSEVYKNYKIYCAKINNKMVGISAAAEKFVTLYGKRIRALYFYDLRIHPDYRHQGIAKRLSDALVKSFGPNVDCYYSLIAGQNKRAFEIASKGFGADVVIPLTYMIFPVFKELFLETRYEISDAVENHTSFMKKNEKLEFVPEFEKKKLAGYVTGFKNNVNGCSIWTNENLLCERVERIPIYFQIYRTISDLIRPFIRLPVIPKKYEILRSWFLFDFHIENRDSANQLLYHINNYALSKSKTFLYILTQNNDPVLSLLKRAGLRYFKLPYFFLAKGSSIPQKDEKIYIDIRDL
jgi:GNAT superfamily N-acetyltransferase